MGEDREGVPIDPDLAPSDPAEPLVGHPPARRQRGSGRAQPAVLGVIAAGGMLGATARFKIAEALPTKAGHFPWSTFWTNVSGSFLLGFVLVVLLGRFSPTRLWRPFLVSGILGAFTTMSTYQVETVVLIKDGHVGSAVLYSIASLAVGLGLAYAGMVAGRLAPGRGVREQP